MFYNQRAEARTDAVLNQNVAISFENVSKIYRSYSNPRHRLLEMISGGRKNYSRETRALDDVSFILQQGGRLGIVGENGSGKSTLLKVLAGVLTPSSGNVRVSGRISALLELGAGFNPDLSGKENIRQYCMLHGMQSEEVEAALPEIVRFSELRESIDYSVKTYSSGMAVRLGFSCAVYVKPDILIVDEALGVGDAYFQNKCLHRIKSLLDEGTTFIYVTHAADAIRALCNQGLWMERGRVKQLGNSTDVGSAYQAEVFRRMAQAGFKEDGPKHSDSVSQFNSREDSNLSIGHKRHAAFADRVAPLRTGSGQARIQDITVVDTDGTDTDSVEFQRKIRVRVFYEVLGQLPDYTSLNLGVTDSSGRQVLHFSSASKGVYLCQNGSHAQRALEFEFENQLCPGEYGLISGIGTFFRSPNNPGQSLIDEIVDYCAGGARFSVVPPNSEKGAKFDLWGLVHVPYSVSELSIG